MARRFLPLIAMLAALLHGVGIARSPLPAQDGLKFMRVARDFHHRPWADVVRSSDQHPLYPAMIALVQPILEPIAATGPDSWRLAAQVVSAMAAIATILPLFLLARTLVGEAAAILTTLLYVLLPLPAAIGHDTLSDPLFLLLFTTAFAMGVRAVEENRFVYALLCGVVSGLGFLTRPEGALVPVTMVVGWASTSWFAFEGLGSRRSLANLAGLSVAFLAMVGSYAVVKGEVSEKLALRRAIAIPSTHDQPAKTSVPLPPGLDHPRWDFAAKEETDHAAGMTLPAALTRFASRYGEAMGFVLVPLALWGLRRVRGVTSGRLVAIYGLVFSALLVRHAMTFGYLSARHTMTLVVLTLPLASWAILAMAGWVRDRQNRRGVSSRSRAIRRCVAVAALLTLAISVQLHHAPHPSRWGHGAAGEWLAANAAETETVLDTRGWATFVSGRSAHDYWHVKQALTDKTLAYVVVGEDERTAQSRRGETLRAVLAYAAEPVAEFPERLGGTSVGVRVYRFHPPRSWEGLHP